MSNKNHGFPGKMGGLIVRDMIRDVEQRMANGEHISAGPDSPEEAALINQVKEENKQSGQAAH